MATTTHDDGFHEIQLNGKQLVFLFMAGTVVAVVIFLLGVFVGRGVAPRADGSPLTQDLATQASEAPEIPATTGSSGTTPPATANEDLKYPDQLNTATPPRATLEPRSPSAAAAEPTRPASEPTPAAEATTPATAGAAAASAVPGEPAGDGFSIQVAALARRDEAEGIVRRLGGRGYSAYLIAPAAGAPTMYRVRVGKFKDRREAEAISSRLQKEEQFKPWIVR
jgi:cell division septation protein DedD